MPGGGEFLRTAPSRCAAAVVSWSLSGEKRWPTVLVFLMFFLVLRCNPRSHGGCRQQPQHRTAPASARTHTHLHAHAHAHARTHTDTDGGPVAPGRSQALIGAGLPDARSPGGDRCQGPAGPSTPRLEATRCLPGVLLELSEPHWGFNI